MNVEPADRVRILDTSLRDGEQAPGFSMSGAGKLRIAKALEDLGVDVIEAGFAAASSGDAASVRAIAQACEGTTICSLARAQRNDIDRAIEALAPAERKRIHVFIATSPVHRRKKLGMSRQQVLDAARSAVGYARELTDDVEWSAEDAIRTEQNFLAECIDAVIEAGATTINVPDTVGYATPDEIGDLFAFLYRDVVADRDIVLSTHCHDDLGLACANSLAAVRAGARQVECTLHGIGERAGNCAMEEIVMALRTRRDALGVDTAIDISKFAQASGILSEVTGVIPSPNKAIVGANAFSHESGIHQHGVLNDPATYEIMSASELGFTRQAIVLGKHSGRHAFIAKAGELGFELNREEIDHLFAAFKCEADRLGTVSTPWMEEFLHRRLASPSEDRV